LAFIALEVLARDKRDLTAATPFMMGRELWCEQQVKGGMVLRVPQSRGRGTDPHTNTFSYLSECEREI
jgi:hypothetical protein